MNELALFAGAGGGLLGGILLGWKTVCYVENNAYCVDVLSARIREGYLCDAPIWGNIKTFNGYPWAGLVDVITAGFPCQPFSVAGKGRGRDDDRNLWPETIRLIREVRPIYAFLENVPNLLAHKYIRTIFGELAESGYDARWRIVSAADVGAPHVRKRLWILAHSRRIGWRGRDHGDASGEVGALQAAGSCARDKQASMAHANDTGRRECRIAVSREVELTTTQCRSQMADAKSAKGGRLLKPELPADSGASCNWWRNDPADAEGAAQSQMGRVVDGMADRVDRLRAVGNGQVPQVARIVWKLLVSDWSA